ncbi:ATP-binding protein [Desulfurococcaceae archaeon MEX13E-LK6-19]|nr:ATP-binding protein [Desulfurococcaceae archaeon MEX13E-LK6-19]
MYEDLKKKIEAAENIAREHGVIIGRVSRSAPSSINEEGGIVIFDVDPEVYFTNFEDIARSGGYLAVVDIKSGEIISLRIIEVTREDLLAQLNLPEFTTSLPRPEATGLLTRTRVKAKPLLAYNPENGVVSVAGYVIEPQSPIIKPTRVDTIQKILGLPTQGVFLGYVTIGDQPAFNGLTPLYLPLKAFYQHVLVLGTTGSGKTTLLKNLVSAFTSCYNFECSLLHEKPSIIVMDPNKDYVHLPLKPLWEKTAGINWDLEKKLLENTMKKIRRPKGLVIILPITQHVIDRLITEETTWVKAIRIIADEYFKETYKSVIERVGWRITDYNIEVIDQSSKGSLRYACIEATIDYGNNEKDSIELFIIPYGFRFKYMEPREFIELNPFFTQQAKDALYRILIRLRKEGVIFNTLNELYEAIQQAKILKRERKQATTPVIEPRRNKILELINSFAIHKATLDNIIRQIGSMIDTGFFDIKIPCKETQEKDCYLPEPSIEVILEKHLTDLKGYPIVVDLEYLQENSPGDPTQAISIAAFRILNKIFLWKLIKSRSREISQPVLILMDEAHRFFPSRGAASTEYIEHVSAMIDRIARLGRARRLGIIFSTHSPKDVHDIILQLTNTKIILRMDKSTINVLDIPSEYKDFIIKASDRVGLIRTHALRLGYTTFRTPLPLGGHYDLSAIYVAEKQQ